MRIKHLKSLVSLVATAFVCGLAVLATPNIAQSQEARDQAARETPISLRDTFPIGSNALCEAQILAPEAGAGLFDRKYSIICRDAAAPIGTLWTVRGKLADEAAGRFGPSFASCGADGAKAVPEQVESALDQTRRLSCADEGQIVRTELLVGEARGRTFAASGLSAYEKALELGLLSLVRDRTVEGTVDIPLTQTTDALAFARQQAEAIASDQALIEAYRRSNSGEFAEAAEFFAASAEALTGNSATEAKLNEALLQSNLGNFAEAERVFGLTRPAAVQDPLLARLQRNYEAIDALNQSRSADALQILAQPIASEFDDPEALSQLRIGQALARRLAAEDGRSGGSALVLSLTPLERRQLLDGQADYLRARALRLTSDTEAANTALLRANTTLAQVREGRVVSITWLRAQVLSELAEVAERTGRAADAELLHQEGIALLTDFYPNSPALQSARAQLAGFYGRSGRKSDAINLYRAIVADAEGRPLPSLRSLMSPYFALLLEDGANAEAAADIFAASQLLQRPGLAQTQAVLARELSTGDDEAALLFRKTTNMSRSIEQLRGSIVQLKSRDQLTLEAERFLAEREEKLVQLQAQQAEILQKLAEYPRYRAVTGSAIDLAGLQAILREGEAYVKMVTLADETFVVYATAQAALAYQADATPDELDLLVDRLRESIAIAEGGEILTFPFDLEGARELYVKLFNPVGDRLPSHRHIVFEPDGALLKLPINLLVTDDDSVARYKARLEQDDGDEYDFTGTSWLGRTAQISTSVSPAAFRDVRRARPSSGNKAYLGLGQNKPISDSAVGTARTRSALAGGENCIWSPNIWANPIKADELFDAAGQLGEGTTVLTEDAFTDTAIAARDDLNEYRILHFATHGLVTAPQPECPPRPALLTSFGEGGSDGLLSFAEIFELRIDADLVILSACDTAGGATVGATREAGVTSGGDFALDGLVRAFVGAGGRTVLASHWPVPDDYDATKRLISGLFEEGAGETAGALRKSQLDLMDDADTSHPFYWSAFAVVGDGAIKATRQ
ncbi:MAG: CHAT domain-containing protein [Pseudomonadota bacterium]